MAISKEQRAEIELIMHETTGRLYDACDASSSLAAAALIGAAAGLAKVSGAPRSELERYFKLALDEAYGRKS